MAWFLFESEEEYLENIVPLLKKADLDTLDKIAKILIKHLWPQAYIG